jgi:hypothetical protein
MSRQKTLVVLMPWYGPWPDWIELYLESCKWNPTVNWVFFSDQPKPNNVANNVRYVFLSLKDFSHLAGDRLRLPQFKLCDSYKLCDIRPAFGTLFEEYIKEYDYFGFGDLDVIYGNLRMFLDEKMLIHDVISFHKHRLSGHLCFFANTEVNRNLHFTIKNWQLKFMNSRWLGLGDQMSIDRAKSLFFESYNTPFVKDMPWKDGTYNYPTEWYWNRGRLTNNIDQCEFLYFHFMVWKGGRWERKWGGGQFEKVEKLIHVAADHIGLSWKINEHGFWNQD